MSRIAILDAIPVWLYVQNNIEHYCISRSNPIDTKWGNMSLGELNTTL